MINWIVALVLGLIHALSFYQGVLPSWSHAPIQMLSFSALFFLVLRSRTSGQAFFSAYLFGISSFCASLYWLYISMHVYGHMPAPMAVLAVFLFSSFLAIYYGLAALLSTKFLHLFRYHNDSRNTHNSLSKGYGFWLTPFIWAASITLAELARGYIFTGFPWNAIAYS